MEYFRKIVDITGATIDAAGVLIIVTGAMVAAWRFLLRRRGVTSRTYRCYRQDIGMAVLLGLIVTIRTFLRMSLQLGLEGRWPWQRVEDLPPFSPSDAVRSASVKRPMLDVEH